MKKEIPCRIWNCPMCELGSPRKVEIPVWDHESKTIKIYQMSEKTAKHLKLILKEVRK